MTDNKEIKPMIIAHRGASNLARENTMDALKLAYQYHADGIEFDLRKTKDGVILLNHDPSVDEFMICDYTYNELKEITMKKGYIMPKFNDVVDELAGKLFMDIELKEPGFENEVIELMLAHTSYEDFMIRSFNKEIIIKVKEIDPKVKTALILGEKHLKYGIFSRFFDVFPKKHIKKTKCDVISPYYKLLLFSYIKRMHKLGIPVSVWMVKNMKQINKLTHKGVDYVIMDFPFKEGLDTLKKKTVD